MSASASPSSCPGWLSLASHLHRFPDPAGSACGRSYLPPSSPLTWIAAMAPHAVTRCSCSQPGGSSCPGIASSDSSPADGPPARPGTVCTPFPPMLWWAPASSSLPSPWPRVVSLWGLEGRNPALWGSHPHTTPFPATVLSCTGSRGWGGKASVKC
uniref:Uncharacterized protein n=1 Tax=Myotis myotis TaxID=51298 RepID=A0A7J7SRL3_MYOMY|nr:hypothetical protein mMyoMyo1_009411 [Myotis myotis]